MKALFITLSLFIGSVPVLATDHTIAQAEADAANVQTLVLHGSSTESNRLLQLAPKLTALETVVFDGITNDQTASSLVSSVAACNNARTIRFRNCVLEKLPANLRMLTQVSSFESENSEIADGDQFYNAIADMPNVRNVAVTSSAFRSLPKSFSRLRTMDNINLVNTDIQLASGFDRNTKTPDELRATQSVQFGFDNDALNLNYTCYNAEAGKSHVQMFRDVLQGAYRESNVLYTPASTRAFVKNHPLVKPPVKGVDIAPDVYSVNPMTGSVVEYGSGTTILIPSMAFEDVNGNLVQGPVDITYREFRDQVDVVLSGIPMDYDSAGTSGKFESAGMFEMQASQNGTEVFLRDEKEIELKFAVTDTASDFNFYRLDEVNGWTYLENTGTVEEDAPTEFVPSTTRAPQQNVVSKSDDQEESVNRDRVTIAVRLYCNAARQIVVRDWLHDTTDFDVRYNDTCYYGITRSAMAGTSLNAEEKSERSSRLFLRKRIGGDDFTVLSLRTISGRFGLNSELSAYSSYHWMINEKMTRRQVDERFGKEAGINDCRVIQDGDEYYLELKYYWGYEQIKVQPVRVNSQDQLVTVQEKQQQNLFNSYTRKLNSRRARLNRYNQEQIGRHNRGVERAHRDSVRAWNGLNRVMSADEKQMDFTAWNIYAGKGEAFFQPNMLPMVFNKTRAVYQRIRIPSFGLYNCDRVIKLSEPVAFVTKVISVAGAVIVPVVIHVVDKLRNRVMSYAGGTMGDGVRATYEKGGVNYLLFTDEAGKLYKVSPEEFQNGIYGGEKHTEFMGEEVESDGATAQSVRKAATQEVGLMGFGSGFQNPTGQK